MPVYPTAWTRRPLGGEAISLELSRLPTGFLVASFWPLDSSGDRYIRQGVILAEVSGGVLASSMTASQPYYVPYSVSATYGTGSNTAVGILAEPHDETLSDWQVSPVNRGVAVEKRCYEPGGPIGVVTAAVKANLSRIEWR